jgi:hypothetical protein
MALRWATALTCLLLAPPVAGAAWDPPGWRLPPPREATRGPTNPAAVALTWAVRSYQNTASRVDDDRCPSYPTCSQYAVQALHRHGPLLGTALTAGRLISEADEAAFAARIRIDGRWRIYAPLRDDLAFLGVPLAP